MSLHSVARSVPGGLYLQKPAVVETLILVPTVPLGARRLIGAGSSEGGEWASSGTTLGFNLLGVQFKMDVGGGEGGWDADVFLKNAAGERYVLAAEQSGSMVLQGGPFLMEEGESVEADISNPSGPIAVMISTLDLQGPIRDNRVILTDQFQAIVPAPVNGKIHIPIATGGPAAAAMLGSALEKNGAAINGQIDFRRFNNETELGPLLGSSSTSESQLSYVGSNVPNTGEGSAAYVPYKAGQSLRAKLQSSPGGKKSFVSFPYLVVDDPDA
jgi:hypothetical protein